MIRELNQNQQEKLTEAVMAIGKFLETKMMDRSDITLDFVVTMHQGGIRWINVSERINKEKIL